MDTNVASLPTSANPPSVFSRFPVAMFGSVMGLTGLSVAWRLADERYGLPPAISETIGAVAVLALFAGAMLAFVAQSFPAANLALLENNASFFGAQMTAMDNATRNAGEMIKKYTLAYNRQRQAQITKELIEIISGAEAL